MKRILNRSVLFSPADRMNILKKAVGIESLSQSAPSIRSRPDVVIIDLEDSVAFDKKAGRYTQGTIDYTL